MDPFGVEDALNINSQSLSDFSCKSYFLSAMQQEKVYVTEEGHAFYVGARCNESWWMIPPLSGLQMLT